MEVPLLSLCKLNYKKMSSTALIRIIAKFTLVVFVVTIFSSQVKTLWMTDRQPDWGPWDKFDIYEVDMLWLKVKSHSGWLLGTEVMQQNWQTETCFCTYSEPRTVVLVSKCDTLKVGHMHNRMLQKNLFRCSVNPLKVKYKWNIVCADVLWKVVFILMHQTYVQMIHFTLLALFFHWGFIMWVRQNSGPCSNLYEIVT